MSEIKFVFISYREGRIIGEMHEDDIKRILQMEDFFARLYYPSILKQSSVGELREIWDCFYESSWQEEEADCFIHSKYILEIEIFDIEDMLDKARKAHILREN